VDADHIIGTSSTAGREAPKAQSRLARLERVMEERRTAELLRPSTIYKIDDAAA